MDTCDLKELIEQRFDNLDLRIDGLTEQVKETNGRVRSHESTLSNHAPRLSAAERDIKRMHTPEKAESNAGENRRLTKWDALLVLGAITSTIAVLRLLGMLQAAS